MAITVDPGGKLVLGGRFTAVNGQAKDRFARLLPDGGLDEEFGTLSGANGDVLAMAMQPDSAFFKEQLAEARKKLDAEDR